MAYSNTLYSSGSGFTSSCLDDIPFKLGPKFRPPTKVMLPPHIDLTRPSQSTALSAEYTFEVEEAVLQWSAERERQLEEQMRMEQERQAALQQVVANSDASSDDEDETTNGQPQYQNHAMRGDNVYENVNILQPEIAPRPVPKPRPSANPDKSDYVNVTVPNPLIANISNDILKPTPINSSGVAGSDSGAPKTDSVAQQFDVSLFEKEDDPFDNLELQTINDMEELASVLHETTKNSPVPVVDSANTCESNSNTVNGNVGGPEQTTDNDIPTYENVPAKVNPTGPTIAEHKTDSVVDISKLPPVPVRRDLVGRSQPLPPIGSSVDTMSTNSTTSNRQSLDMSAINRVLEAQSYSNPGGTSASGGISGNSNSDKPSVASKPRTSKYSRYDMEEDTDVAEGGGQVSFQNVAGDRGSNSFNVQFKNDARSSTVSDPSASDNLAFVNNHFGQDGIQGVSGIGMSMAGTRPVPAPRRVPSPPSRPSSQQSWNRYTPLPPPSPRQDAASSSAHRVTPPAKPPSPTETVYNKLSIEGRTAVDNLVNMGFPKGRVVRAVEKIGQDEKEVVEYLCLVDQLSEKGYKTSLVENALLLFQNSMKQASMYLELFTQLQELGFNGDKIKEALVNTNNDREKSLDILMASS